MSITSNSNVGVIKNFEYTSKPLTSNHIKQDNKNNKNKNLENYLEKIKQILFLKPQKKTFR